MVILPAQVYMNQISAGRVERDKVCQTKHMCGSPSAAQTCAHTACRVIWPPKSRQACGGWPVGGTEGQSIMREWKTAYRTDDTEKYEWCNAEAGLDFKKDSGQWWIQGKEKRQSGGKRKRWIMGLNWVVLGQKKAKMWFCFSIFCTKCELTDCWSSLHNKRILSPESNFNNEQLCCWVAGMSQNQLRYTYICI